MNDTSFSVSRLSRIKEVGDYVQMSAEPSMRVYSVSPETSSVQLRINASITDSGKGASRKMLASAILAEDEVRTLRDLLDQELQRLGDIRAYKAA